ncbi:hypothetical protein [Pseudomonas sp. DC1.2]|uniref:hypothetical protein n=1 Tax=Pseudomonas sp. DC1.2 TaxID=3048622 RepID=UPI003A101838
MTVGVICSVLCSNAMGAGRVRLQALPMMPSITPAMIPVVRFSSCERDSTFSRGAALRAGSASAGVGRVMTAGTERQASLADETHSHTEPSIKAVLGINSVRA